MNLPVDFKCHPNARVLRGDNLGPMVGAIIRQLLDRVQMSIYSAQLVFTENHPA